MNKPLHTLPLLTSQDLTVSCGALAKLLLGFLGLHLDSSLFCSKSYFSDSNTTLGLRGPGVLNTAGIALAGDANCEEQESNGRRL